MDSENSVSETGLQILSAIFRAPLHTLIEMPDFGPTTGDELDSLEAGGFLKVQAGHWSLTKEGHATLAASAK